ncbi:hypothetical protein [Yokenella regensburgei]|uniref:hypothetical protein n=1 Tax=Yokenella regensburgei TaxID=158877 RepID=UPI001432EC6A|nr:hypothetical protein [Yokenella regensburgei]QIU92607.1 hypothetical protein HEC60_25270 [Yokenella regensburgei]
MKKSQFTEEIGCLSPKAAEPGTMEPDVCHKLGISDVLFDGADCVCLLRLTCAHANVWGYVLSKV